MTFGNAVKSCLKKYLDFSGRANRPEFWYWVLFTVILQFFAAMLDIAFGWGGNTGQGYGPLVTLVYVSTLIPTYAVMVRRLHDTNRSAWWISGVALGWIVFIVIVLLIVQSGGRETKSLTLFVGAVGLILFGFSIANTVFLCLRGSPSSNRFGSSPQVSGDSLESSGRAAISSQTAEEAMFGQWVFSGFDSVGNVIRLEFSVRRDRDQVFVIGRNRDSCDLVITDQGISRRHAEISVNSTGVYVRDLGSSNGTFLNGQKLGLDRLRLPVTGTLSVGPVDLSIFGC